MGKKDSRRRRKAEEAKRRASADRHNQANPMTDKSLIGPRGHRGQIGATGPVGPMGPPGPRGATASDCCVKPLAKLISQLVHPTRLYTICTTDNAKGLFRNVRIEQVLDTGYLVMIMHDNDPIILPVSKIVGLISDELPQITLEAPPEQPRGGVCECSEAALREYFHHLNGTDQKVTVHTHARQLYVESAEVERTGEGIVILKANYGEKTLYVALSLCQITAVEPLF